MNLQKQLYRNKKLLQKVLENINPAVLIKLSQKRALKNFYDTSTNVKAYQSVLKSHNIRPRDIANITDFLKLPIIDKQSYISHHNFEELLLKPLEKNYTIEESSGFSGKSSFWPRFDGQDDLFADYMELGLIKTFSIDKKSTLLINTWALGTWVTGFKFGRGACLIANKPTNKLTVVNAGIKKDSVYKYLDFFEKSYDQIIIAGYPPFIKEIIENSIKNKIIKEPHKINLLMGGEGFPEEWRDYIASLLGIDIEKFNQKILSAYGAADVGLELGYEQPITVLLRRLLIENSEIRKQVIGVQQNYVPHFFQYNPLNMYVEVVNGELIYTAKAGIPTIRYNLHDSGNILSFDKVLDILSLKYDIKKLKKELKPLHLPVLYLMGRTDGVIPVSSANVYVEQIKSIVNHTDLQKYITGKFFAYSKLDVNFKPELFIVLEADLINNIDKQFVEKFITKKLCSMNQDYNEFYISDTKQFSPRIDYLSRNEFSEYTDESIKIKYIKK
jgi:phenylacetate-CoA ligase